MDYYTNLPDSYYDDYYEIPMSNAVGCYCKLNFICSECKRSYN